MSKICPFLFEVNIFIVFSSCCLLASTYDTDNEVLDNNSTSVDIGNSSIVAQTSQKQEVDNKTDSGYYDDRDVIYFLDNHHAQTVIDPRALLTGEKIITAQEAILHEICSNPNYLRFAYLVRLFREFGRKIASKMDDYLDHIGSLLKKMPKDLIAKEDASLRMIMDDLFDMKGDPEMLGSEYSDDQDKIHIIESAISRTSSKLGDLFAYIVTNSTNVCLTSIKDRIGVSKVLSETLYRGSQDMIDEIALDDRFMMRNQTKRYLDRMLDGIQKSLKDAINSSNPITTPDNSSKKNYTQLGQLTDEFAFRGVWNSYLFSNLGSSERALKLFSSLLARVPRDLKDRWINMHSFQMFIEMKRTLINYIAMLVRPYSTKQSQDYLVKTSKDREELIEMESLADSKKRLPNRCYLAGRRWKFILVKALHDHDRINVIITKFEDKISEWKQDLAKNNVHYLYRSCMPRIEDGFKGVKVNRTIKRRNHLFERKDPLDEPNRSNDPFKNGFIVGYRIGFKLAYNDERNNTAMKDTVPISSNSTKDQDESRYSGENTRVAQKSYRVATLETAKSILRQATYDGYLSSLKVSIEAGLKLVTDAGSLLASKNAGTYAKMYGMRAGIKAAKSIISESEIDLEETKDKLVEIASIQGQISGQNIGGLVAGIVGGKAADEAFRRKLELGDQFDLHKFVLDEYSLGMKSGFEHGSEEGRKVATSESLDPSAPAYLDIQEPNIGSSEDFQAKSIIPAINETTFDNIKIPHRITVKGALREIHPNIADDNNTKELIIQVKGFMKGKFIALTFSNSNDSIWDIEGSLLTKHNLVPTRS